MVYSHNYLFSFLASWLLWLDVISEFPVYTQAGIAQDLSIWSYPGNPGYIGMKDKMRASGIGWGHTTGFHAKSLANQVVDGAERSCERRAPGELWVCRRGSTTWLRGYLDQENAPTSCVHDKQRHIFFKQHKHEMQEGVFCFSMPQLTSTDFFLGSIWRGCLKLPAFFHVAAELLASTGLGLCLGLVFPEASRGRTPDDRGNFRVPWAPKSTLGLGFPNKILMDWFLTRWCWTRWISVG